MTDLPAKESTKAREHLANERTLLAWVRTAIAFMGLGFVVARFGLFLRQIAVENHANVPSETAWSGVIGVALVAAGTAAVVLSAVRFLRAKRQIEDGRFEPEAFTEIAVVGATVVGGIVLVAYLALS